MMLVIHQDLRVIKFCNRGARLFCERHGIDWQDFVVNGIDSSRIDMIDDEMVRQVLEAARLRTEGESA